MLLCCDPILRQHCHIPPSLCWLRNTWSCSSGSAVDSMVCWNCESKGFSYLVVSINGWFIEKIPLKWMMTGGTPISGNLHLNLQVFHFTDRLRSLNSENGRLRKWADWTFDSMRQTHRPRSDNTMHMAQHPFHHLQGIKSCPVTCSLDLQKNIPSIYQKKNTQKNIEISQQWGWAFPEQLPHLWFPPDQRTGAAVGRSSASVGPTGHKAPHAALGSPQWETNVTRLWRKKKLKLTAAQLRWQEFRSPIGSGLISSF